MLDLHFEIRDESGNTDEAYLDQLIEAFVQAPEGQGTVSPDRPCGHWVDMFLRYYLDHIGCCVAKITARDVREVLFELIPQKVSVEAEMGPAIVREVRAFWAYLGREYRLPQAAQIEAMLDAKAGLQLEAYLSDPSNFGMAKSFVMAGLKAGFDMTTQEGVDAAMANYNETLLNRPVPPKITILPPMGLDRDSLVQHTSTADLRKKRKAQRQAKKKNRR